MGVSALLIRSCKVTIQPMQLFSGVGFARPQYPVVSLPKFLGEHGDNHNI
jgi:hypothetical protein